jgi:signal transduction histidine kinase
MSVEVGPTSSEPRVLVVAPVGRTSTVTCDVLRRAGIAAEACPSLDGLCDLLGDDVGAVLLLEEALHDRSAAARFADALDAQPPWSDLSVTVFVERLASPTPAVARLLARATNPTSGRSIVVIERPVPTETVCALAAAALRDRRRQYRVRDLLLALEESARAAEAASLAKGDFLTRMTHELRTPLNAIQGHVQLLEMEMHGPVTEAQAGALARVAAAQRRLLGLVDGLLDLARIESGRVEYDMAETSIDAVLDEVLPLVEVQASAKRITVGRGPRDPAARAWADARKLEQVLLNLLANAVKFTSAGGSVSVTVTTRAEGADGGRPDAVFVRVADTGPGVPADQQERIFEPFRRADTATSHAAAGTGLGLAISRDLARGMGGELRVRSRDGAGAVFTVTLRRA